jgi:hypothetical protein
METFIALNTSSKQCKDWVRYSLKYKIYYTSHNASQVKNFECKFDLLFSCIMDSLKFIPDFTQEIEYLQDITVTNGGFKSIK